MDKRDKVLLLKKYIEDPKGVGLKLFFSLFDRIEEMEKRPLRVVRLKGNPGAAGKTPKKGVDYFTKKDITDIVNIVNKSIEKDRVVVLPEVKPEVKIDVDTIKAVLWEELKKDKTKNPEITLDAVVKHLKSLQGGDRLHWRNIDGLEHWLASNAPSKKGKIDQRWHGGGDTIQLYDLSPYLDGVTRTFTIPAHRKITLITASSAPFFFRPTVDYTSAGTTLTFDAAIDPAIMLAQGQSVGVQYVV